MRFEGLVERIDAGWSAAVRLFPRVLQDPRAYPREAMILGALAALLVVLVTLTSFVVADAAKAWAKARRLRVKRKGAAARGFAITVLFLAGLVLVLAAAPVSRVVSERCTLCHEIAPAVDAWKSGPHAGISCYACHAQSGPFGVLASSFARIRYLRAEQGPAAGMQVASARCLSCHRDIRAGVVGRRVRMRHSDVIAAGYRCDECHASAGHEGMAPQGRIARSSMNACLGCHDGKAAPAECAECHSEGGPLDSAETTKTSVVRLAVRCTGCHAAASSKRCVSCHGLELPHPVTFMSKHAGLSFRSPALCAKCHERASATAACACHEDVNLHGTYSEWFPLHGPMARRNGPGGCRCHRQTFCAFCHERPVF